MQELGANQVKQIADSLDSDSARAALHAIVGCAGAAASSQGCGAGAMGAAASSVIGSLLGPTANMSAAEREARENLVNSLVAGIATASGVNAATATGAAQIEVENNQVSLSTATGFRLPPIPGFKGETAGNGDGVIADPATELDANIKAGPLVTPLPGPGLVDALITAATPDWLKALVTDAMTMAGSNGSDDVNLASPDRTSHILAGDSTGGGHQWPGGPGKSVFPENWSASKIMNTVSDIATDPSISETVQASGRIVKNGSRDGIDIRVIIEPASKGGGIVTAFPTNVPRNSK
jgi:filamentous hemagglutinin